MIKGVITRVGTLVDKTVRLTIDCPPEMCPADIVAWQYEEVMIDKEDQENGARESRKEGNETSGKDRSTGKNRRGKKVA